MNVGFEFIGQSVQDPAAHAQIFGSYGQDYSSIELGELIFHIILTLFGFGRICANDVQIILNGLSGGHIHISDPPF